MNATPTDRDNGALAIFVRAVLWLGALFFLGAGIFAFVDPQTFYDEFAPWAPYNEHFIHDIGAFQIGIGAALLLAAVWSDAQLVVLAGAGAGGLMHFWAHVQDHSHGGKDSDVPVFGVLAVILLLGAAARWWVLRGRAS